MERRARPRKKLNCAYQNLDGEPFFLDLTELDVLVEELFFNSNNIRSLDPEMFRDQPRWTGLFFAANKLKRLNASAFENMTGLVKLDFARNKIRHIDAHFVPDSPVLRRIETEAHLASSAVNTARQACHSARTVLQDNTPAMRGTPSAITVRLAGLLKTMVPVPARFAQRDISLLQEPRNASTAVRGHTPWRGREHAQTAPAGQFSVEGSTACSQCQVGKYSQFRSASCTSCAPGTYGPSEGLVACRLCPEGKHLREGGAVNELQCKDCEPGTSSNIAGVAYCATCDSQTYARRGWLQCEDCPPGKFSPAAAEGCAEHSDIMAELLTRLPVLLCGVGVLAMVSLFVLWMYRKDRRLVESERKRKKRYFVPISSVFGLFDFFSDLYFAYSLQTVENLSPLSSYRSHTYLFLGPLCCPSCVWAGLSVASCKDLFSMLGFAQMRPLHQ